MANSEQRTANSEQRTANSEQRTANSEQRTANSEPKLNQQKTLICTERVKQKKMSFILNLQMLKTS